jgi:hypothetical protein
MVTRMDALFLVDRDARQKAMSSAERLAQRRELAQAWVEEIRDACRTLSKENLPKSALGKAAAYTLNQWPKLARCLEHEEVELSNNLAENSMRPVALGRNYVHSRIMCSRPRSGWRAGLAQRGFAGLARTPGQKYLGPADCP